MREIREIIESSELSPRVRRDSLAVFGKIAAAEALLHHSTPEEIHFHEIGGLDSLLDIVGVAWCLEYLEIDALYASALPLSSGFVDCAHGRMPVPAPATLEILKGALWESTAVKGELVTPTGAGIVAAFAQGFGPSPGMILERVGLGAGKRDFADRPNLLRVSVGEMAAAVGSAAVGFAAVGSAAVGQAQDGLDWTRLALLETNVDDMNPELWDAVYESLFAAGALDVWLQPIAMKKNRPAQMLGVLAPLGLRDDLLKVVLRETSTLGVRVSEVDRASLPRELRQVETEFGMVTVKVARWEAGGVLRAVPEYEDVKRLSRVSGVSAREVYAAAAAAGQDAVAPE